MSLSQGSLIVRSRELLEPGQRVQMTVHLVDSGQAITIIGEVVWANHSLGDMALRFLDLSEGGREAIAEYLLDWAANR
jgi:Tfp pilus assembly protein PilZ